MPIDADMLFRHTSDAILVLDGDWRITYANPRAETLLLRSEGELVGASLADGVPDLGGSKAEGQLEAAAGGRIERRVDHFAPSRYTWFEIRAVPSPSGLTLFLRDVTDRTRQTKTEAVREAVRQIVMNAPVAISITRGPEHRYELVNAMARRLIGDRELEGRTARAAFPEIDPSVFDMLDAVYRSGEPRTIQDLDVAFDRDGSGRLTPGTFDVTYQPLLEADGTVSGILTVSVETTSYVAERRRLHSRESTGRT